MNEAIAAEPSKPWWRKVGEFPLVAMVLALLVLALGLGLVGAFMVQLPVESLGENAGAIITGILIPLVSFAVYKLVIRHMGEHPRDDLPLGRELRDLPRGIIFAAVLMTAIVGIAALLGAYRIEGMGGSTSWAMLFFLAGTQAAFFEELLMRGILFRFLEEFGGSWFALALSSLIFGFLHAWNDNATMLSSLAIAVEAGILLGGAYMLTRNLWLAIGIHFGWNVVQGYIWDVPVSGHAVDGLVDSRIAGPDIISGGMFGLEASVIAMVLATAAGIWLVVLAARKGNIVKPWWVRRREQRLADPTPPTT